MNKSKLLRSNVILLAFVCGGCTIFPAHVDDTRYFILSSQTGAASVAFAAGTSTPSIGLGPVTIPGYLDRPEVVTRVSSTELKVSEKNRWGERLRTNVATAVAQDLSNQMPGIDLVKFPWPLNPAPDYQVSISFEQLELTGDGQAQVNARWTLRSSDRRQVQNGTTNSTLPAGKDERSASEALSRGVEQVSHDIATALATMLQERKNMKPEQAPSVS